MIWLIKTFVLAIVIGGSLRAPPAQGRDRPHVHGEAASDAFALVANQRLRGSATAGPIDQVGSSPRGSGAVVTYVESRWVSVCAGAGPTDAAGLSADCGQANTCPKPAE